MSQFSLKQPIGWGDHLKVDEPQIDAQHQAIVTLALEISDVRHKQGSLARLKALAEKLPMVLEAHFRYEEQQLAAIGYPKLAEHRAEHETILGEMEVLRTRLDRMEN